MTSFVNAEGVLPLYEHASWLLVPVAQIRRWLAHCGGVSYDGMLLLRFSCKAILRNLARRDVEGVRGTCRGPNNLSSEAIDCHWIDSSNVPVRHHFCDVHWGPKRKLLNDLGVAGTPGGEEYPCWKACPRVATFTWIMLCLFDFIKLCFGNTTDKSRRASSGWP